MQAPPVSHLRLPFIDRCRAIALLLVVLYHASLRTHGDQLLRWDGWWFDPGAFAPWQTLVNLGLQWLQVPALFFLFSGYLVHRSLGRRVDQGVTALLVRRGLRLYIPYLAVLVLYGVLWHRTRVTFDAAGALDGLLHVLLLHNTNNATVFSINASFWYVATELQLCALYPLAILATRRWGWRTVAVAILGLDVSIRLVLSAQLFATFDGAITDEWLMRSPAVFAVPWFAGAWIADRQARGALRSPRPTWLWLLPAAGFAATVAWPLAHFAQLFMSLSFASWMACGITRHMKRGPASSEAPASWLGARLDRLGMLGMGIYLLNQPLVDELHWRIAERWPGAFTEVLLTTAVALALVIPAAFVMARVIEEPLARRADRLVQSWQRPRRAPLGAATR